MNNTEKNQIQATYQDFFSRAKACTRCRLRKTCTQVVPGEGSPTARVVFIGEGPGKKEDELGRPFVGAAGKFLDEMLASIKLERGDVYIANVVKCRPPNNRDPQPDEIAACRPWLDEQLKIINPDILVTLGRHAMGAFLPESYKISQSHGKPYRVEIPKVGKKIVYALYHPAAALYNGGLRETLIKDFSKIPKILKKIDQQS